METENQTAPATEKKKCRLCKAEKPLDEFGIRRASPDGKNSMCKKCNSYSVKLCRERQNGPVQKPWWVDD